MKIIPQVLLAVLIAAMSFSGFCAERPPGPAASAPNILVLIADDLGWGDVGFHKGAIRTPNLDRLAKEGVELQRFYAYPVCSPTRAALFTGQMPRRFGIVNPLGPREPGLPAGLPTLPRRLQSAGYQTFLVGKWHVGTQSPPQQSGFDHFYGFLNAEVDYFKHTGRNGAVDWQRDGHTVDETGYSTFLIADEAIRLLAKRDVTRPFFLDLRPTRRSSMARISGNRSAAAACKIAAPSSSPAPISRSSTAIGNSLKPAMASGRSTSSPKIPAKQQTCSLRKPTSPSASEPSWLKCRKTCPPSAPVRAPAL